MGFVMSSLTTENVHLCSDELHLLLRDCHVISKPQENPIQYFACFSLNGNKMPCLSGSLPVYIIVEGFSGNKGNNVFCL